MQLLKYKRIWFWDLLVLLFFCAMSSFLLVYGLSLKLLLSVFPFVLVLATGIFLQSRRRRRWVGIVVGGLLLFLCVPTLAAIQGQYLFLYEKCSLDKYEIPWLFSLVFMLFVVLSIAVMVPYFLTGDLFLSDVLEGRFPVAFVVLLLLCDGSALALSHIGWPVFWGAYGPQLIVKYPGVFYVGISVAPLQHYTLMLLLVCAVILMGVLMIWLITLNAIDDGTAMCLQTKSDGRRNGGK